MVMRIMKSPFYIFEEECGMSLWKSLCLSELVNECGLGVQSQFNWNQYNKRQKRGKLFYFYSTAIFSSMESFF